MIHQSLRKIIQRQPAMPDAPSPEHARIFGLDLLRAFAITCVVVSHYASMVSARLGLPHVDLWFVAGVVGVEAFFVLSGFLIGNMLLNIVTRGITWKRWLLFIQRRCLRVMPVYYLWLVVLFVTVPALHSGIIARIHYFTFTQNLAWPMPTDNWFGVSWSLTVEMWFYLLFSALALSAARWKGMRGFAGVLALFLLAPIIARACMPLALPWDNWVRKITFLRLDAIAYGVLAAVLMRTSEWVTRQRRGLFVAGMLVILASLFRWLYLTGSYEPVSFMDRTFLLNTFLIGFGLMLPALLRTPRPGRRALGLVNWVSEVSYALYLTHLSILIWFIHLTDRVDMPLHVSLPCAILATLVLVQLSRHLVEKPILSRRPGSDRSADTGLRLVPMADG